jgi:sugar phosphate isomerase/epimerase
MNRRAFLLTFAASRLQAKSGAIRPGCQTRAYGSPLPRKELLLEALDGIAAAGFEGFETNYASLEHSFDNPGPMKDEFRRRNLALIGLHASGRIQHKETAEADMRKLQRIAKASKGLGGSFLVLSGPGIDPAARQLWCENLNALGKFCRETGVRLCVHNHLKELQNNAEELKAVAAATDPKLVSFLLDLSYFSEAHLAPREWLPKFASRLAGLHLRDYKGKEEVLLGEGDLDYRGVNDALRATRWHGWLILEMNRRKDMSSGEMVKRGREFMKQVFH